MKKEGEDVTGFILTGVVERASRWCFGKWHGDPHPPKWPARAICIGSGEGVDKPRRRHREIFVPQKQRDGPDGPSQSSVPMFGANEDVAREFTSRKGRSLRRRCEDGSERS
jgi:hypothetical protein